MNVYEIDTSTVVESMKIQECGVSRYRRKLNFQALYLSVRNKLKLMIFGN